MASFGEILADFKSQAANEPENIAPLINNSELMNGLIAWKSVVIHYKEAKDCPHVSESEKWAWLWDRVEYSVDAFGVVAGVKRQDVAPLLTRLKGLRLIYPDGTINARACQYLQGLILGKLRPAARGKERSPSSKSESNKPEPDKSAETSA